jgi:hypoxanthine phosphoribosyltransferase
MKISPQQAQAVLDSADLIHSAEMVEKALDRLAQEITQILGNSDPVVLCVMNGALVPSGHLLTRLAFPLRQDYIHATRYRGNTTGSTLEWIREPQISLQDQTVLVLDDILDEGITLAEIVKSCGDMGAKKVYSAVLVEKHHDRGNGFQADFVGLKVDDRYVFGLGMDYKGYLRNSLAIYAVNPSSGNC